MPAACEPSLWTDRRYSAEIVSRLNRALDELVALTESTDLFLFGHSGGGTLAMLLAGDRNDVRGIVSIAANLDHRLWTQTRGFRPLAGSLNPVELPPLTDGVARMHLAGANDRQVPAEIVELASRLDPRAIYRIYDNFDHHCCWNRVWPAVIGEIQHRAASTNAMPAAQRTSEGTK